MTDIEDLESDGTSLPKPAIHLLEDQRKETPNIVGIRFRKEGKVYSFDPGDHVLPVDELVIVETDHGLAMGKVCAAVNRQSPTHVQGDLKRVLRIASDQDLLTREANRKTEEESRPYFKAKVKELGLPMKLIDVECLFDKSKIIFYFSSEGRVDFRDLVKELVQKYRTKIELKQIGSRHEARIIKGLGVCGREVCCTLMSRNFDRVSVKMAKEQNLSLNPEKISGLCGRLMCCLAFEYDTYLDLKGNMPKCGKTIQTPQGKGKVIRQNVLSGEISVLLEDGKETTINMKACPRGAGCQEMKS